MFSLLFQRHLFAPSRFVGRKELYSETLEKINTILLFHGIEFKDDGKFHQVPTVKTLTKAEKRVSRLTQKLTTRQG